MDDVDTHHLELERYRPFRLGVDGHEVVLAGDLQAVPRIEEDPGLRPQ